MAAVVLEIADAVTASLNGASLTLPFTAERSYVPVFELKTLATLRMVVMPRELVIDPALDRRGDPRQMHSYIIDIGIAQRVPKETTEEADIRAWLDLRMLLAQDVCDLFRGRALDAYADPNGQQVRCVTVTNIPIFDQRMLDEKRVFFSLVSPTFRLGR